MNMEYSNMIEHSDLSSIDKKKLRDFIEVLNKNMIQITFLIIQKKN